MPTGRKSALDILAIFGPTAVGKSRVAVEVAGLLKGEIISADSMQVYRGLPILTDQPSAEMLARVPHHLIADRSLAEEYSAALFAQDARAAIADIGKRGSLPLIVGGTGLYLRALLGAFSFAGRGTDEERERWRELIREEGVENAYRELQRLDPEAAARIDPANTRRVARALEAAAAAAAGTGTSMAAERDLLWSSRSPYRVFSCALVAPRDEIYRRIDERVGRMLETGAVAEVRQARRGGVSATAAKAIGFAEICDLIDGRATRQETAARIRIRSRRYAKRQLTWMRKMPDIVRIDVAGRRPEETAAHIAKLFHEASDASD